jgi:molecular chaperone DnaK
MAPRGHPQIEVTFDIDANGIMNVSAKDKATGKVNNVTIKSSGGLSDADIDRMVNEAEAAAESDADAKKVIELKNEADQYIYNTEKQLQEHSSKIPDNIKDQVRGDISSLNEAVVAEDSEKITEALERLKNSSMEIGKAIYSQGDQGGDQQDGDSEENKPEEEKKEEEQTEEAEKKEEGEEGEKKKDDEKK